MHLQNYLVWFWPLSLSTPFTPTNLYWPPLTPALPSLCPPAASGSSQHLNAVTSALISGVVVLGVMSLGLFILSLRLLRKPSPSSLTGVWNPSFRWPWRPNPECTEIRQTIFGHCSRMSQNCHWLCQTSFLFWTYMNLIVSFKIPQFVIRIRVCDPICLEVQSTN